MRDIDIVVVTLAVVVIHLASPRLTKIAKNWKNYASFSGGLAIAYVFLHLIPELDAEHDLVGERIYFVALLGFTALYGLEYWLRARSEQAVRSAHFGLRIGTGMVYNAMLVYTLGMQLPASLTLTVVFVIAIGMDLLSDDIEFVETYEDRFLRLGRFLLAAAGVAGFALSLVRRPHEVYIDLLTATLAGFMLYDVLRDEALTGDKGRFPVFLAGIATFSGLHLVLAG
jgi:hypothetical protein